MVRGPAWLTAAHLADHVWLTAHVDVYHRGLVIATGVEVLGGRLESSLNRDVMDRLTFTVGAEHKPTAPWDPFNKNGQKSHVTVVVNFPDGTTVDVDLGFFQHDRWSMVRGGLQVTAFGLLVKLKQDPFIWPTSPVKGSTVGAELERICSPHLTVADSATLGRVLPAGLAWGNDKLAAVHDMCEPEGLFVRVENDQQLHVYSEHELRQPAVTYSADDLLLDDGNPGDERQPNIFTGYGGDSKDVKKRWAATVVQEGTSLAPSSYGTYRELVRAESAKSERDAWAAADAVARKRSVVSQQLSFSMLTDPRLEVGDVAGIVLVDDGTGGVAAFSGRVVGHAFPLVSSESGTARVDIEVLRW